jgi:hypothetical protein
MGSLIGSPGCLWMVEHPFGAIMADNILAVHLRRWE